MKYFSCTILFLLIRICSIGQNVVIQLANSNSVCANQCQFVDPNLVINGNSGIMIENAKIYFASSDYVPSSDLLSFTPQFGITGNFNNSTGQLILNGNATLSQYQTVLRNVCYQSTSLPTLVTKKLYFSIGVNSVKYNDNNGHFYKLFNYPALSWHAARDSASNKYLLGNQGYLATITDGFENGIVSSLILPNQKHWIGANDALQEGVWRWVTGCEGLENGGLGRIFSGQNVVANCNAYPGTPTGSNYTNWQFYSNGQGEPSDCGCYPPNHCEDFMCYDIYGLWNDLPNIGVNYYIVEFGCASITGWIDSIQLSCYPSPTNVYSYNVSGCVGNPIHLNGTPAGGIFNIVGVGSTTNQFITFTTPGVRFYTYTYTDLNGCTATSSQSFINVLPLPNITATVSPSNIICSNTAITLTGSGGISTGNPAVVYSYFGPSSPYNNPIEGTPFTPAASATYTVAGVDTNGCIGYNTFQITVGNSSPPTATGGSRCGTGIVNLSASGSGTHSWYYAPSGGSPINTSTIYSPTVSSSTTFYVDNTELIGSTGNLSNVGPPSNLVGAGLQSVLNQWELFNVIQPCTLQSVIVYPGAAGNVILEQRNSTGTTIINTSTMAVTASQVGTAVIMTLNWPLTTGIGYRLYKGASSVSLYRNSSGISYPYTNSFISITGNSLNPSYYFWAYNWTISNIVNHYCTSTRTPVVATVNSCLNLTLYIQGYYTGANSMVPALMNEGVGASYLNTDSIEVELHSSTAPYGLVASNTTILHTNGSASCTFPNVLGSFYIVVHHRNGIQTWSANPVMFGTSTVSYNFTTGANQAYGNNMIQAEPGVWAIYSGDLNIDENLDLLDISILENDIANFQFGYLETDLNGDGNADLLDAPILEENVNNFIFSNHP